MDYVFSPQQGLLKQLGEWLWFWIMIGVVILIVGLFAYGMGKSDNSTGDQVGSVENSAPASKGK